MLDGKNLADLDLSDHVTADSRPVLIVQDTEKLDLREAYWKGRERRV